MVEFPADFRDLLIELVDAGAEALVVGGYAVAFYGHPRATKDLDVFVNPDPTNAARVFAALSAFGAPLGQLGVRPSDFSIPGGVVQIGLPPMRVDIITQLDGVDFEEAARDAGTIEFGDRRVRVIGRAALLKNKRAAGRLQDQSDVLALERLARE